VTIYALGAPAAASDAAVTAWLDDKHVVADCITIS
jgi:hypothetical protein